MFSRRFPTDIWEGVNIKDNSLVVVCLGADLLKLGNSRQCCLGDYRDTVLYVETIKIMRQLLSWVILLRSVYLNVQ